MNIPPNQNSLQQMGGGSNPNASWRAMYSGEERQKVVQIIINTLTELHGSNPNFNVQRLSKMAQDFEKLVYERSASKEDYLRAIKMKVHQLRVQKQQIAANQGGQINPQQRQQQQQQQISNSNSMNPVNAQNVQFLRQQAQARSQSQAQIQARQQQLRNMVNQQLQQQQQPQPQQTVQPQSQEHQQDQQNTSSQSTQQNVASGAGSGGRGNASSTQGQLPPQLVNLMRTSPIPPPLLNKMPKLPAGVNTWNQIFDLIRKRLIPPDMVPTIRDIHGMHLQLFIRQQQQKLSMQRNMNEGNNGDNLAQGPNANNNNNNINTSTHNNSNPTPNNFNNLTPQQRELLLRQTRMQQQLEQQKKGQQPMQQATSLSQQQQQKQQQQQQPVSQSGQTPQLAQQSNNQQQQQQQPQITITQEDYAKYSNDALNLLAKLQQQKQMQGQINGQMKEAFIKKFIIHQKTLQYKQRLSQQATGNANVNIGPSSTNQQQLSQIPNQQHQQQQQQQQQVPQSQPHASQQSPVLQQSQPPQQAPVQNVPQGLPGLGNMATPQMKQGITSNPTNLSSPLVPQQVPVSNNNSASQNNNINRGRPVTAPANITMSSILPPLTDEVKLRLRQLIEEVSRNNVVLRDVTSLLSNQDKTTVRDSMNRIQEQYGNVDSIISYFYLLTKNGDGTKRLIQMKYMTKNILDNLHRGIYLAGPDLLEKVRSQYAKYFEYVKEQINLRRQQVLQQGGANMMSLQQQQQQQQQNMTRLQPQSQQQQQMMQNQSRNQAFMNQNQQIQQLLLNQQVNQGNWGTGTGVANNQMNLTPQLQQQQPPPPLPPQQQQQQTMQLGVNSSPVIPQQPTPIQHSMSGPQQVLVQQQQQQQQQQPPQRQQSVSKASQKLVAKTNKKGTGQGRKKKASISAGTAPTPGALPATTPGTLANAIKTPHNIPTPQIPPQTQSNKNTPSAQSPAYPVKATPSSTTPGTANHSHNPSYVYPTPEIDIFAMSSNDSKLAKRRELINIDPEKFFYASLANLLDLDDSIVNNHDIMKTSPRLSNGKPAATSPLSPKTGGEWTSEVKALAITTSFKQVDLIRELANDDFISSSPMLAIQEVEEPQLVKREHDADDDLDSLFTNKKANLDGLDFDRYLYEPVSFDEWKYFVVSSIQ